MGEPANASVRLQLGNKTLVEMKVGSGREQLQNLQKDINQFLTELIVQQSGDQSGDQGKDESMDDDSDSETDENNPNIKRMKMS